MIAVPLRTKILLRPDEAKDQSEGGIFLPEMAREKPKTAIVVSCGMDVKSCGAEQRVIFSSFAVIPLEIDGETLLLADEEDILVILRD